MTRREQGCEVSCKRSYLIEARRTIERCDHVKAFRPARLDERAEADVVEKLPHDLCGRAHGSEIDRGGIQVEDDLIRIVDAIDTTQSDVVRDRCLVGEIDEGRGVVAHDVRHGAAFLLHLRPVDPIREVFGNALAEDASLFDAVREALQSHGTPLDLGHHERSDSPEVLHHVGLGVAALRKKDLVRLRQRNRASTHAHGALHRGVSRTTSGVTTDSNDVVIRKRTDRRSCARTARSEVECSPDCVVHRRHRPSS